MTKKSDSRYIDTPKMVKDYLDKAIWQIKENANLDYSFSSVFFRLAGESVSRFVLTKVYPKKIAQAHLNGDFHLHNLYMGLVGYCAGWSIKDILVQGFKGVPGKIESARRGRPPSRNSL